MKSAEPTVGMGVTKLGWTDRYPYTIVEVINTRRIVVQEDNATRVDQNGMSDYQKWEFSPNPDSARIELAIGRDGQWREKGSRKGDPVYKIGHRDRYYDFSF